ncbi:hypothetical protein [Salinarimonas rosea]|uniref:AbiJ-related protein n=1 Tax=Salinarimonas rosea TaxID=552063 RepID=UPI0012EB4975|nr:hypothetical protein [Salinarimonas rosea]
MREHGICDENGGPSTTMSLSVRRQIEGALPTAAEVVREKAQNAALSVLSSAQIEIVHSGDDNWNGGTELWTVRLRIPVKSFVLVENEIDEISSQIAGALSIVIGKDAGFWVSVEVCPRSATESPYSASGVLSARTRVAILDEFRARKIVWYGALDDVRFLERIYDLTQMPSYDSRYRDAYSDIYQHTINNDDHPLDWVYSDRRINLKSGSQEKFLEFVCQVVHPLVRTDPEEQDILVRAINAHLNRDGWELVEDVVIDGRPNFVAERKVHGIGIAIQRVKAVSTSIGAKTIYQELERLQRIGDADPGAAIGIAKDLVESCCKIVLNDRGRSFPGRGRNSRIIETSPNSD